MKKAVYALYDLKAEFYGPPIVQDNDAVVQRSLIAAVRQPGSTIADHPNDFRLYQVGEYNDATGELIGQDPPRLVCDVSSLVKNEDS